ncbi:MAG: hypothetical protein HY763_05940 [Planctomycetes bacterium]|nr:hypothetical protein [Planctomycetota bacterium]
MDAITNTQLLETSGAAQRPGTQNDSLSTLGSDDFFKLLITQLTNQDPLQPTGNEELLRQISSIREIELSTTLTKSLQTLTGQQSFSSASAMIGQYVTASPDAQGLAPAGVVVGVRFEADGSPVLQLSDGSEVPLTRVAAVQAPQRAAEAMIGRTVTGVDRRDAKNPVSVEGVVAGARMDQPGGEVMLELDTGAELRLRDVVQIVE